MKKYIAAALILCLTLLCACGAKPVPMEVQRRTENEIIRDLIMDYNRGQSLDLGYIAELREIAPDSADLWTGIINYWDEVNSMVVPEALPDGIESPEKLCIVVLGFQLNPDGSMKEELIGRLETALACARQYPQAYVLCTGGGTAAQEPSATEAGVMADWLEEHGVSRERLIVENRSLSTVQNAQFSTAILTGEYPDVDRVAIVTSDYHVPWGAVLFETQFRLSSAGIAVVHYAGFPAGNPGYNIMGYETSGIMELAGIR